MDRRPSLSINLPPGFDFRQHDDILPKTPDQHEEPRAETQRPPPPPRQVLKIKRKRIITPQPDSHMMLETPQVSSDAVIPTIEMSEAIPELSSPLFQASPSSNNLLSPLPAFARGITPPKTPAPRLDGYGPESPAQEWGLINDSRSRPSFARSGSVGSSFSDSSVSSCGSSAFSAPNGSCASPESVATDPFLEDDVPKGDTYILSPTKGTNEHVAKRAKKHRHVRWTPEMDHHLEATYMQYVRDPRVTPFKMLPGVAPPLGVCSRVAAKAKRTWSTSRAGTPTPLDTILESSSHDQREGTPDTIRPSTSKYLRHLPQWPRSEAATRRRLRKLVKSKPKLSAYYTRLMNMRSPSPFSSSSTATRSSEPPSTAFSSRDMGLSLITSTAPSMQPEGPLAQLSSEDSPAITTSRPHSERANRPADWFARIPRSQAHQKSLSLQSELSVRNASGQHAFLASPFDEDSNRSHLLHSMVNTKSLGRSEFKANDKRPSLDSPFEMPQGAPTAPRSLKRRFKSDEEKPRRMGLEDVFGPASSDAALARNRGFTVGASRTDDNLTRLFEPPPVPSFVTPARSSTTVTTPNDQEMTEAPPALDLGPLGSRSAPRRLAEPVPRLGSPFMESLQAARTHNTFPRSYVPSSSNPNPFQQRLRELVADDQRYNTHL